MSDPREGLRDLPIWDDVQVLRRQPPPPMTSPTAVPGMAARRGTAPGVEPRLQLRRSDAAGHPNLDWAQVAAFRAQASRQLTDALRARETTSPAAQRELGRSIILELLEVAAQEDISTGRSPWTMSVQQGMAEAIYDALFGLGRLQRLVDDDQIENIEITGFNNVLLEDTNGRLREGPSVAESDEELIDFLVFLASRSEANARPFSEAQPSLHLRLDGGARLAATAWITPRPTVVIRRHRLREITLGDLVQRGMVTGVAASFLAAAVRAKKSIVVSGPQGAGKTTMVRALCAELDPWERIGTFETEYELHLHELPNKHRRVVAWEARPGSGERGIDGRQAGEITLSEILILSFRYNLSRQIVGEVRGPEVLAMIKAMQSGAGSISTTHAANAVGAIRKLVTCAMEAGPQVTEAYAQRAIAEHIDLIVQLSLDTHPTADGAPRRDRYVSEIVAVQPGENGPAHTHVFRPAPGGTAPSVLPDDYRDLERFGFRIDDYTRHGALR